MRFVFSTTLLVVCVAVVLSCKSSTTPKASFVGPGKKLSVGAQPVYRIRFGQTDSDYTCQAVGAGVGCHTVTSDSTWPAVVKSASVDNAALMSVTWQDDEVAVTALAPGKTVLRIDVEDEKGNSDSLERDIEVAVPDRVEIQFICDKQRAPKPLTLSAGNQKTTVRIQTLQGDTELVPSASLRIDWGALTYSKTATGEFVTTPAEPTTTHITSPDFPALDQEVRIYGLAEVAGFVPRMLVPKSYPAVPVSGPYLVDSKFEIDVGLDIGGQAACRDAGNGAEFHVKVTPATQTVCCLSENTTARCGSSGLMSSLRALLVKGTAGGTCTLEVSGHSSGISGSMDIEITAKP